MLKGRTRGLTISPLVLLGLVGFRQPLWERRVQYELRNRRAHCPNRRGVRNEQRNDKTQPLKLSFPLRFLAFLALPVHDRSTGTKAYGLRLRLNTLNSSVRPQEKKLFDV